MLLVENLGCEEIHRWYRQHEQPCVFDYLIKVIHSRFDVLAWLGLLFFVFIDVENFLFYGETFLLLFSHIQHWEALEF